MTNDENTYIGMSLPEGIRYITVFEKGDFENCGRILRTFYHTEDRVRKLLALGNLLHLGGSLSSNENKTSCWPLNNGNRQSQPASATLGNIFEETFSGGMKIEFFLGPGIDFLSNLGNFPLRNGADVRSFGDILPD